MKDFHGTASAMGPALYFSVGRETSGGLGLLTGRSKTLQKTLVCFGKKRSNK